MIDNHTQKVLDFNAIKAIVGDFTSSAVGKNLCDRMVPLEDPSQIKKLLMEVTEMKEFLEVHGEPPLAEIKDIEKFIKKSQKEGIFLLPEELLAVLATIQVTGKLKSIFYRFKQDYSTLYQLSDGMIPLRELEDNISRVIGSRGEILDNAGTKLKQIRAKIKVHREKIQGNLMNILNSRDLKDTIQEKVVTLRNGRYVIPIKSGLKGSLPGIVHDQSQSKATYFVEPLSIVKLNNDINILCRNEKRAEEEILLSLTNALREKTDDILKNLVLLSKIDLISAKSKFSEEIGGREPIINETKQVNLTGSRHPLLVRQEKETKARSNGLAAKDNYDFEATKKKKGKVVPIDIRFGKNCRTLIISGANTGGKTVALKTAGLLTLMLQAGMHIPVAEGSETTVFSSILADIGDEQNIRGRQSTFSAHVAQLNKIFNQVDSSSLVLLDELGVGTDPDEGGAVAMAALDYLSDKGACSIVTTHLDSLKTYAHLNKEAVNVSVEFDRETLKPTYRLLYGIPGTSNALAVLTRSGTPKEIVDNVFAYLPPNSVKSTKLLNELAEINIKLKRREGELKILQDKTYKFQHQLELILNKLNEKKGGILKEIEKEARLVVSLAEQRMKTVIKSLAGSKNESDKSRKAFHQEKTNLLNHFLSEKRSNTNLADLKIGQIVKLISFNKFAKVVNIDLSSSRVELLVDNLKVKSSPDNLELVKAEPVFPKKQENSNKNFRVYPLGDRSPSTNLIGMTIDEALPLLDKSIDNAILRRSDEISIIHGCGTGRLRDAVHNYLKKHEYVTSFSLANLGGGVTVAEIKN